MDGRQSSGIGNRGWISGIVLMAAAAAAGGPPGETSKRPNVQTSKAADDEQEQKAAERLKRLRPESKSAAQEDRAMRRREALRRAVQRSAERGLPTEPLARNRALSAMRREMDAALKCEPCRGTGRFSSFRGHVRTGDVESGELRRRTCPQCGGRKKFPGPDWLRLFADFTACTRGDDAGRGADPRIGGMNALRGAAARTAVNDAAARWFESKGRGEKTDGESMLLVLFVENVGVHVDEKNRETPVIIGSLCDPPAGERVHVIADRVPDLVGENRWIKLCVENEGPTRYVVDLDYAPQTWVCTLEVAERWLGD